MSWDTVATLKRLASPRRPRFFAEIVDRYTVDARAALPRMRSALEAGDKDALREAAHALKGGSRSVGARQVAACCEQLEGFARAGDLDAAESLVVELPLSLERAVKALASAAVDESGSALSSPAP